MMSKTAKRMLVAVLTSALAVAGPAGASEPSATADDRPWDIETVSPSAVDWNTLTELDLRTAARIALAANPSLAAAQARVRQAKEQVRQVRSAYYPRLDANLGGSRIGLSRSGYAEQLQTARVFDPLADVDDPQDVYGADLTATWVLFNGFERKFSNLAATYRQRRSESARLEVQRLLLSSVATTYFAAQLAQKNIDIAAADEAFNQRQLVEARARRRVGTGSLSDELNFEVRVNAARVDRVQAEQTYEAALVGLAALLGAPDARFPESVRLKPLADETRREMTPPDADRLTAFAQGRRPDVIEAAYSVQQVEAEIKVAQARFWPTIDLAAAVEGDRVEDAAFETDDFGSRVSLRFTYNLFSGGQDRARLRETKARREEFEKELERQRLAVSQEVRESATRVVSAQRQLDLQRTNLDLVRRTRDLVEKEYAAGQASLVRLNEAQRDLTLTQSRLALALASLRQAWFTLESDTGRILEILQ